MTKKELLRKLGNISDMVDSLGGNLRTLVNDTKDIYNELEDLPVDEEEIEDSEKQVE